jgi:hypothetical protein
VELEQACRVALSNGDLVFFFVFFFFFCVLAAAANGNGWFGAADGQLLGRLEMADMS